MATSILYPERQTTLNIIEATPLSIGYGSVKQHLTATIDGTNQVVSLIERNNDPLLVQGWLAMREAGIPTVPTLRQTSRNTLLVTDVKADGSEVYGRGLAEQQIMSYLDPTVERQRLRPAMDQRFLKISAWHRFHKIRKAAINYADRATDRGLCLPYDDPFEMLVRPDGSWGLIALDVRETRREDNERARDFLNKDVAEKFLNAIQGLRKDLLRRVVTPPAA